MRSDVAYGDLPSLLGKMRVLPIYSEPQVPVLFTAMGADVIPPLDVRRIGDEWHDADRWPRSLGARSGDETSGLQ